MNVPLYIFGGFCIGVGILVGTVITGETSIAIFAVCLIAFAVTQAALMVFDHRKYLNDINEKVALQRSLDTQWDAIDDYLLNTDKPTTSQGVLQ